MSLINDLRTDINDIISTEFEIRDGKKVPESEDIRLGNDAVKLQATILYADMAKSTTLVDGFKWWFAAKIYKSFLRSCCKIIRSEGGEIVAFDGDRVMAIYIGDTKNTIAVKTALKINHARRIINELISKKYASTSYELKHCIGIDTSEIKAIKAGIRGANDLVWIGKSANYAAKMTELAFDNNFTWISDNVYKKMIDDVKFSSGTNMWQQKTWSKYNKTVYCSNYYWNL